MALPVASTNGHNGHPDGHPKRPSNRRFALTVLLILLALLACVAFERSKNPAAAGPTLGSRELSCEVSEFTSSLQGSPISAVIPKTFECLARQANTDKVTYHNYQYLYSKYLSPARLLPMSLLEIGLGCIMGYGAGHSFKLWRKFLPRAAISYLEYNASCTEAFRPAIEATGGRAYVGSQDDPAVLQSIVASGQTFDVIIDDGRHLPTDQIISLRGLWPALKSGGVYIIEDIFTEYIPGFQNQIPTSQRNQTLLAFVRAGADAVHCSSRARRDMGFDPASQAACQALPAPESQVAAFECMAGACAFVKRVGKE